MAVRSFCRSGRMINCSRGAVMAVDSVKKWTAITAGLDDYTLMLYTEDTYEIEVHPYFGYCGAVFSKRMDGN